MGGTAYLMNQYNGSIKDTPSVMMEKQRLVDMKLKKKADEGQRSDNEPGEKAFQRAEELLAADSMEEAEDKLKYIVSFYPSAKAAKEARRILGEMNMDKLLDPDRKGGKKKVKVKSGDSYTRIVTRNSTTMDNLAHLSKLMLTEHNRLRAGQKLTVMPLNLRVVIDTRRKTLTLWRKGEYIKEYPLKRIKYKGAKRVARTKVASIRGELNGRTFPSHTESYRAANKVIGLTDKALSIRALPDDNSGELGLGFFLSPMDAEELPLVLRPGNDVEIRK